MKIRNFGLDQGAETGVLLRSYFVVAALNEPACQRGCRAGRDFSNAEEGQKVDFDDDY